MHFVDETLRKNIYFSFALMSLHESENFYEGNLKENTSFFPFKENTSRKKLQGKYFGKRKLQGKYLVLFHSYVTSLENDITVKKDYRDRIIKELCEPLLINVNE